MVELIQATSGRSMLARNIKYGITSGLACLEAHELRCTTGLPEFMKHFLCLARTLQAPKTSFQRKEKNPSKATLNFSKFPVILPNALVKRTELLSCNFTGRMLGEQNILQTNFKLSHSRELISPSAGTCRQWRHNPSLTISEIVDQSHVEGKSQP